MRSFLVSSTLLSVISLASPESVWSQTCVDPPTGLLSSWPGEDNAKDIVGVNDGTLENGATFADGHVGRAFKFGAANNSVLIQGAPDLEPQQLTVGAWVFADRRGYDGRGPVIVSKDVSGTVSEFPDVSYALFGPGSSGNFTATVDSESTPGLRAEVVSPNSFSASEFHHVAMTWDGSTLSLFVNGQLQGTHNVGPQTIAYDGGDLGIGMHPFFFSRTFTGLIDEIELYDRALMVEEIQAIFGAGSAGKCIDSDSDGVPDVDDMCPNSGEPTIVMDGVDTGIVNTPLGNGCTVSDQIAELLASNPSQAAVVRLLVDLKGDGAVSGRQLAHLLRIMRSLGHLTPEPKEFVVDKHNKKNCKKHCRKKHCRKKHCRKKHCRKKHCRGHDRHKKHRGKKKHRGGKHHDAKHSH